jgi:pimeloyl-ACP methyl ester carboxylesterase
VWNLTYILFFIAFAGFGYAASSIVERPKKLVVAHGGFNSCKNHKNEQGELQADIFKTFHFRVVAGECKPLAAASKPCHAHAEWLKESIRENLTEKYSFSWFVSCQAFDVKKILWVRSDAATVQRSGTREEMWTNLVQFAVNRGPAHVIGHSYGGWTAMHSALKISGPIRSLTTIDPISPLKCTPVAARTGSDECKKFPSDIEPTMLQSLHEKTAVWQHYWQKLSNGTRFGTLGLHSGPTLVEGVKEMELQVDHVQIDSLQLIWDGLKETVAKEF